MRCLTLADALRERGVAVMFVCCEHEGHLCDRIAERGIAVSRLKVPCGAAQGDTISAHAVWLGASWREDAEQTWGALEASGARPEWLVVDHYALDHRWESALRRSVGRIMVIDDLADRRHNCDLLLDQNLVAGLHTRYADKVPAMCATLLGPEWALLQPVYGELRDRIPPREGAIRRILIFYGGADGANLTGRTIAAFLRLRRPDIDVDVVIAANDPHAAAIREQLTGHANIRLRSGLPTLAPLMARADLAVGASGASSWERLCLGLPSLVVTLSENQRPIADELNRRGLVRWLGHHDEVDEPTIEHALDDLIRHGLDEAWSLSCRAVVDGKGGNRVCAVLTVTADTPLYIRHAQLMDEALLLEWANDVTTRRNSFSMEPISAATHRGWFRSRLRDIDHYRLYIVEAAEGVALGYVRFERKEQAWEVHYALAPPFRGRGIGCRMLEAALLKLRVEERSGLVFGRVKSRNRPSCKVFEALGFETVSTTESGAVVYQRVL